MDYVPAAEQVRRAAPTMIMVRNDDGLLNVPEALRDRKNKRTLRMVTLTKEDKLKAQLVLL